MSEAAEDVTAPPDGAVPEQPPGPDEVMVRVLPWLALPLSEVVKFADPACQCEGGFRWVMEPGKQAEKSVCPCAPRAAGQQVLRDIAAKRRAAQLAKRGQYIHRKISSLETAIAEAEEELRKREAQFVTNDRDLQIHYANEGKGLRRTLDRLVVAREKAVETLRSAQLAFEDYSTQVDAAAQALQDCEASEAHHWRQANEARDRAAAATAPIQKRIEKLRRRLGMARARYLPRLDDEEASDNGQ